jgi:hypothetical protein
VRLPDRCQPRGGDSHGAPLGRRRTRSRSEIRLSKRERDVSKSEIRVSRPEIRGLRLGDTGTPTRRYGGRKVRDTALQARNTGAQSPRYGSPGQRHRGADSETQGRRLRDTGAQAQPEAQSMGAQSLRYGVDTPSPLAPAPGSPISWFSPAVLSSEIAQKAQSGPSQAYPGRGGSALALLATCRGKTSPVPSIARGVRDLEIGRPAAVCVLSRDPRRGRREAPRRKGDIRFTGSQPRRRISEGRREVLIALVELPANLSARRMEERRWGLLQPIWGCLRLLSQDGGGTFRGQPPPTSPTRDATTGEPRRRESCRCARRPPPILPPAQPAPSQGGGTLRRRDLAICESAWTDHWRV